MAHPDLDRLFGALWEFAEKLLSEQGEFYPFGSTMNLSGEVTYTAAYDGDEYPASQTLIDLLSDIYRRQVSLKEIRAAGICYDVRITPSGIQDITDAFCMSLEHLSWEAMNVYVPYKMLESGEIEYGEVFATPRKPQFFAKAE